MHKLFRISNRLTKSLSVLDVACIGAYSRVKNVFKSMFPEKNVSYDSHTFGKSIVTPKASEICNCVDTFLFFL